MLTSLLGKQILDGFLRNVDDKAINFGIDKLYLGLLTQKPLNEEQGYDSSINYFCKEPADPDYQRVCITDLDPFDNLSYIGTVTTEVKKPGLGEDWPEYSISSIENQMPIMFPEATVDWGAIVAFGLFKEPKSAGASGHAELPLLWGEIQPASEDETTVEIKQGEVPVISPNHFKISLM